MCEILVHQSLPEQAEIHRFVQWPGKPLSRKMSAEPTAGTVTIATMRVTGTVIAVRIEGALDLHPGGLTTAVGSRRSGAAPTGRRATDADGVTLAAGEMMMTAAGETTAAGKADGDYMGTPLPNWLLT